MLEFFDDAHRYLLDGVPVPSVTQTLIETPRLIDFTRIPPSILEDARLRGDKVHRAIHFHNERDLDLEQFEYDFPEYAPYVRAWIAFCDQRHFVAEVNEHRVASRKLRVAGTLDCLGLLEDQAVLLDFKTGRPHDVAANLQTAGYHMLALEWAVEDEKLAAFFKLHPVIRRYAVQLRKNGTAVLEPHNNPTDYRKFRTLVEARQIVAEHINDWEYAA